MTPSPPTRPKLGSKHRILLGVERFSRRNYRLVFLFAFVALVGGAWLGSKLDLESNILALIPEGNRQVDTFRTALEEFGSVDYLIVLVEARGEMGPAELMDFADLFAEGLVAQKDLIELVDYRFQPDAGIIDLFYQNALLFLPPERLPQLAQKLSDEAIQERLREIPLRLALPTAPLTSDQIQNDPLELTALFLNRLLTNRGVLPFDLTDGYYLSRDGHSLILLAKPVHESQSLDFDRQLLTAVRSVERETLALLKQELELGAEEELGISVRYGGNYAVAVDEEALIKHSVGFNLIFSLFAVSALYWLCYRRFAALLYSSLPLLVGQAMTFALCFWFVGQLNAASSAFTALLMGLGTDFVIVIYARYVEERRKGKSLAEATELMIGETGLGVFTGAITSAGTFYAMCYSRFRGLQDLGFLIGSGILLCAVAILFMLPAMIKWNEGVRSRKVDAVKKLHLQSFGLEHLMPFSARHRGLVVGSVVILTAVSAYLGTQLNFEDTVRVLRSKKSAAFQVQVQIAEKFGASLSYMMAIAEAPTREEAIALSEKIEERLAPFLESGVVASSDSILTYLPPRSQQSRVLQAVASDTTSAFDAGRIRNTFLAAADSNQLSREAFSGFLDRMQKFLAPERPLRLEDLEGRGLDRLLQRYISAGDDGVRIVTYLFMSDPRWKRDAPPGLVDALTGEDEGIIVTGTNIVGREFRTIFTREAPRAVMLGLVVVLVLLLIDFRSVRLTMIALSQLVCGVIMMLGLMAVTGISLNYVNAFVATMILGVGIDYSIHLVHRMNMSGGRIDSGTLETGKAVVMAALTNIAGFGTLALGNYPALRSFGLVALFGSVTCLFTALTLVPALMARSEPEA